jgi:hypothetical protein
MALLDFIYQAFLKICDTTSHIFDFLFTTIDVPNVGEIAIWQMLTGATLVIAITYLIIRKFTI